MKDTKTLTSYGLLFAVILLMTFTPLGYIKLGFVEITLLVVPVAIGAIILGPKGGAVLGGLFGLTSFFQCFGLSPFGAMLLAYSPILTFLTCLVPRILMGYLSGITFLAFKKRNKKVPTYAFAVSSLVAPLVNTVLFVTMVILLFSNVSEIESMRAGQSFITFFAAFAGMNGLIEIGATLVVSATVSKILYK